MKKVLIAITAFGLAAAAPHAAHAMECCKDGSCECCKKEEGGTDAEPEGAHQH